MKKFHDRREAGKILADKLRIYANKSNVIILALPRGGVPVAYEIAKTLSMPMDIFIVRKLGVPGHEELAMGAIGMQNIIVFNDEVISNLHISKLDIERVIQSEQKELQRREIAYRGQHPYPGLAGKTIILVDDGIATGATMRVAIEALKQKNPAQIIVAIPVVASSVYEEIDKLADDIICIFKPDDLYSVGAWYNDFSQTTDEEVHQLLADFNNKKEN